MNYFDQNPSPKVMKWVKLIKGFMKQQGLTTNELDQLPDMGGKYQRKAIAHIKKHEKLGK